MEPQLDFRNTNALWGSVLVETLVRCGLRHVVISPGSRSTPLTTAFARHSAVESIPVLDERSAAFLALGLAKQTRLPVALVCTSGTAGANYFPAVIEAFESGVPLLLFTADRPPETRDCASGQTIDQHRLYGNFPVWQHEFAVPEASVAMLRYLRQTMRHAWDQASAGGPVHLNCPFRDPLPPLPDGTATGLAAANIEPDFFDSPEPGATRPAAWEVPQAWLDEPKGIIVAGPSVPREAAVFAQKVAELSKALGWPLLADALSPVRHHECGASPVCGFEAIVRSKELAQTLAPRGVVSIGGWPVSKNLREWIGELDAHVWIVSPSARNLDAMHTRATHIAASIEDVMMPDRVGGIEWPARWHAAEAVVQRHFDAAFSAVHDLFEPKISREMPSMLAPGTPVFVASSMPVRDVEYFWPARDKRHRMFFNRGANGIDGTLSTALGIAHGGEPTVLLTGDLALLHDSNGLLHAPHFRGSLTVVLINNRGGGIFEHLPIAQFEPPFEKFWATPQAVDFALLAEAHGAAHVYVKDWNHLRELVGSPVPGIRILEIATDRKRDAAFRRQLLHSAAGQAERASVG
ncbi:MAG TPA: 2-succinyl-5-enolpyruvyl-6-hydroxy-3-cyclohexene-1-carboxylic-acid synthase [Opitutaceae bacterium]|nr:2-succinyl-5-enolpyruvyl-6-hydroxy-3-cyclohexene-1-carboxylic-acid synthase [Opitutaceae bacterium]